MIPNAGLNNIAAYNPWGAAPNTGFTGNSDDASGAQWLAYAAISEDSSTPTASDTNIGTEKMRTNNTGGFNRTASAIRDSGAHRLGVTIERAYVFAISSNMNITKYGYVPVSSSGNFSWIDLTRVDPNDPGSSPVTLTLVPGDQLQLWQTFTVTVPWSVDLESFIITGTAGNDATGTHDAYCGFYAESDTLGESNSTTSDGVGNLIRHLFWPGSGAVGGAIATPQTPSTARDARLVNSNTGSSVGQTVALQTYTSGTYYRDKVYKFTTAQGNMNITGIALTGAGGTLVATRAFGFKVVFDDPAPFVKTNTHELSLTLRVSWAEA